jgi:hypothetical protein
MDPTDGDHELLSVDGGEPVDVSNIGDAADVATSRERVR